MAKVVVGLSGGVDSAVSAYLLKKAGHEVTGVFMRNWDSAVNNDVLGNPNEGDVCPEEKDWADVQKIGAQLGIPVRRVDFVAEYWASVFADLIKQYEAGRTPNPDILCNRYVKFGVFYDWVAVNMPETELIATGHYAALEGAQLVMPLDANKDQTYFLAQVRPEALRKTVFPLANLTKPEVRAIAKELGLVVAAKKDSTGICFIGERDFTAFLQNYIPAQPGKIVDITSGRVLGTHIGAMYYTIGKRSGIGLSGLDEPYYVCGHNMAERIIYVAPQSRPEFLKSDAALIKEVNWLSAARANNQPLTVKFRYRSTSVDCQVNWVDDSTLRVEYPSGFLAVTPGQQAVFYDGNICLGGGIIDRVYLGGNEKSYVAA